MKKALILAIAVIISGSAWADGQVDERVSKWELDSVRSSINFVSVKKGSVAEVHGFRVLKGELEQGKAEIVIDLASVDTGIAIRDSRMKSMLFEVVSFPSAMVTADIDADTIEGLATGERRNVSVELELNLHGTQKRLQADVSVVALADGSLFVVSGQPVVIKAGDFALAAGVESLRKVAGLSSIVTAVPVTFSLLFKPH